MTDAQIIETLGKIKRKLNQPLISDMDIKDAIKMLSEIERKLVIRVVANSVKS